MTYLVSPSRVPPIRDILESLGSARRVVLTTHLNADGDGAGSQVALAAFLRANGAEAWIVNPTPYPSVYRFLLPDDDWVVAASDDAAAVLCAEADLAVILDTGEKSRIGRVKPLVDGVPNIVIDHHPAGLDPIEGMSFRDPVACATGELVFDMIHEAGGPWPDATVTGLYVALLTDTGSFRHSNTTSRCHRIAAELVDRGADPETINRRVYGSFPPRRLHLLRAALETLRLTDDGSVASMTVPATSFKQLGATPDDLEGVVDYPRDIAGVEVALLFRRIQGGATKVSLRSNGPVDVNELARAFGGGGHVRAAGAVVQGSPDEVRERVVEAVQAEVVRLGLRPSPDPA
jgi:phosphoesterase RecJ-like protein